MPHQKTHGDWRLCAARLGACLALAFITLSTAHAGRSCETRALTPDTLTRGMALAQRTTEALDAEHARSGARVVALARAGQDLRQYQLRYSHLGWAYKTTEGPWRVLHKLNQCGSDVGSIYRQGLAEFFLDDLWQYEAAWSVPAAALQAPLLALLTQAQRGLHLNERAYNMVSYAWGTRYQQSNQWAIETLALAAEPQIKTRTQAQAWLQLKNYQPGTLRLSSWTRLGASVTRAHIRFDDHPNDKRFAGRIDTITVDSVFDWLAQSGLGSPVQRIVQTP